MVRRPPPERRTPVWTAPTELRELMGPTSGNDLNGHGETTERQPTLVMWDWTSDFAHRPMQDLISARHQAHPEVRKVLRFAAEHSRQARPVAEVRVERTSEQWLDGVGALAERLGIGADDLGVAAINSNWVFEGATVDEPWVVVFAVEMDFDELSTAPSWRAGAEVQRGYNRGTELAWEIANWIRDQGYNARGHGGPSAGPLLLVPPALESGLGELGKHGSMIHPRLGSRFRLASVLTDIPLMPSARKEFGADDFCWNCRVCIDACPPGAIFSTKQSVRGEEKWYVDFDLCLPYFAESFSCAVCLAVCPWSQPGEAERLVGTMARKRERRLERQTDASGDFPSGATDDLD